MKNIITYYYFGVPYQHGYMELLDTKGNLLRNNSREVLMKSINEARLVSRGHPLYIIKETTEAEKI
jgi:hypothetical protein